MAACRSSSLPSTTVQLPWALGSVLGLVLALRQSRGKNLVPMLQLSLQCYPHPPKLHKGT